MDEMENRDLENQEFDLEDIMREFSDHSQEAEEAEIQEETVTEIAEEPAEETQPETAEETPAEEPEQEEKTESTVDGDTIRMDAVRPVSGDTIRMDAISKDTIRVSKKAVCGAVPIEDEEDAQPAEETPKEPSATAEAFTETWEPEYEQPIGEYVPPQPIPFRPKSRLQELKSKLVNGPEKRYYALSERGVGRVQAAIFLSILVLLIGVGSTVMNTLGMVRPERMRLLVFGQFFILLLSALIGSNQLVEGLADLFKGRFGLNTLLVFTFAACCVDAIICLKELRVPCCVAFSLEMTMSLWNTYHCRSTEISQMDTMRKANHLDKLSVSEDFYEDRKGFVRGEGQVEDFMDTYAVPSKPELVMRVYALFALLLTLVLGVVTFAMRGFSAAIQVTSVTLLAAVPVSAFITLSRPMALLQRRLHKLGVVLCGWQGVKGLCGKAAFPVRYEDLFPAGSVRFNGVKFYGSLDPDAVVALGTAVVAADGGGLTPLFNQVLESRNGMHYEAHNLRTYPGGGLGAEVEGQIVLVGPISFLKEMEVEVPEEVRVGNAVCVAIEGELSGLFAVSYDKAKTVSASMNVFSGSRGLSPVLVTNDFSLTKEFLKSRFGANAKKICYPEREERDRMRETTADPEAEALLLVTTGGLLPFAYGAAGARALRTASIIGTVIHLIGGILGIGIMATLTLLGSLEMLTPFNLFLYQLVWLVPGCLITEWTRQV